MKHKWCQVCWTKVVGEGVAEWDHIRKLNTFEERYLAWTLLLQYETLVQETEYLASHFCCFLG